MDFQKIYEQLNFVGQCRRYKLPIWQCPQFLFLLMGLVTIGVALITYAIGTHYIVDPNTVSLTVLVVSIVLFVINFSITRSLEGLAEANQLKSEFISIVSHQLRSPLSNLKWAIEFLVSGRLGKIEEKQTSYFKILQENSGRMEELISDLLTVSRIEQGRLPLHKSAFSLEDLVKKALASFELSVQAANVKIAFDVLSKPLPSALGDSAQIRLVIDNFLDNAIRYTKSGGKVKVTIKPKNKKHLFFSVSDNGVGVPKQDQKHIFQKFFRSSNALKHQTAGSGLGLYIAKSIVEGSRGKIGFQSQKNKGSTFWFTMPIKK